VLGTLSKGTVQALYPLLFVPLVSTTASFAQAAQSTHLPKVVSLDYCADQYVLALADAEQIGAVTPDADDTHSFYRDLARDLKKMKPTAENVLAMRPDVAVRTWGGDNRLLRFLQRADIEVVTAEFGSDPEVVARNLELFGMALGQSQTANEAVVELRRKLSTSQQDWTGLTALYVTPGGVTGGKDTFVDEIIKQVGLSTIADELGLQGWQPIPLEAIVSSPPDIVIASFYDHKSATASNWSVARHARIRKMLSTTPTIYVPGRYLSCNGLFLGDAVTYIAEELRKFEELGEVVEADG
jgi:iron complex transport system substrate-binding protein